MTLTFNPSKYSELLSEYQPRLIRTEEENERALEVVEVLMHRSERSPEEDELYELLIVLIEKFEQEYYQPGAAATPHSMLLFLMEQQDLEPQGLVEVFGSEEAVDGVMASECDFTGSQIRALGKLFKVEPGLFI